MPLKATRQDLNLLLKLKRSIWSLDCVSYRDPLYYLDGYFKGITRYLRHGDILIAMGDDDTHVYSIKKDRNGIRVSSLVSVTEITTETFNAPKVGIFR